MDTKIARWERDLERLRVALANATEAVNTQHHPTFVELCRMKEVAKSRWEAIRGVYRPDTHAVQRFEEALAVMEAAWQRARAILNEMFPTRPA
jgi:hypothetical protein